MPLAFANHTIRVYSPKGGQRGYGGYVANVAQDVATFSLSPPRLGANVFVLIVRREGS